MNDTVQIIDLTQVAKKENLPSGSAAELQAAFLPFFEKAAELKEQAMSIKVERLDQTKEMASARAARLALKDIRVNTEKTRVKLKEESLRTGKAIDGMANVIKFLITPIEEYLEEQEKFGERLAEKQRAIVRDERECQAGKYLADFPQSVDLGAIDEYEFNRLYIFAKAQFDAREEAAARIEKERIEREHREAAEREAMRVENERLKAEADKRQKEIEAERAEVERLKREAEAKAAIEREKQEAEQKRIAAEAEAKMRAEKEAAEAPDMEKLKELKVRIFNIWFPQMSTDAGAAKLERARGYLKKAIEELS